MLRFVFFLALLAAVVYAAFWLIEHRSKGDGGSLGTRPMPPRPVGPDDDAEFLRELERRQRHSKREEDS